MKTLYSLIILFLLSISSSGLYADEIKIIIEENFLTLTEEERSKSSLFPAFTFANNQWESNASKIIKDCNKFVEYPSDILSVYCLNKWSKANPINIIDYHLLNESEYRVWANTNKIKIYLSAPLKSSNEWKQSTDSIPNKILLIAINQFKNIHKKLKPEWSDKDIEIIKSFKSSEEAWLIGMRLDPNQKSENQIDDETYSTIIEEIYTPYEIAHPNPFTSSPDSDHWFYISKNKITYLGPNLEPIAPLNVLQGEQSNWLMHYSGYNKDGFVIYDKHFDKKTLFTYSYH